MKLNSLKLDLNSAEDGVFFPMDESGAKIKIAKWNNKNHSAFLKSVYKQHGRRIDAGAMTDAESDKLLTEQWPHIIKDMVGFTEDDGAEFKFSPKAIVDMACNPQFKEFFAKVKNIAMEEQNYRIENVKAMGEVSLTSSNGQ